MSKKRQKQFGAISIFFRTLITAFSIFVAIATILGCVKITQNAEETIEVGANVQNILAEVLRTLHTPLLSGG
jgi:hypothetical protein